MEIVSEGAKMRLKRAKVTARTDLPRSMFAVVQMTSLAGKTATNALVGGARYRDAVRS
jgi:hypothetical protein